MARKAKAARPGEQARDAAERAVERMIALFCLGVLLFSPTVIHVFDRGTATVLGVPLLYFYLFAAWALLVGLLAVVVETSGVASEPADGDEQRRRDDTTSR
jgi:hypothetical protein